MLETIFNSFLFVALTEMGDKTQLLAFILVARFRKPWAIFSGILFATILNHSAAAYAGGFIAKMVSPQALNYILATAFIVFAVWVLVPDKEGTQKESSRGAFFTTLILFFLAEMGDKTQLSTIALAARYQSFFLVTLGTTLGMLFSDGLAIFFGDKITKVIPMKWIHRGAALSYLLFAILILAKNFSDSRVLL